MLCRLRPGRSSVGGSGGLFLTATTTMMMMVMVMVMVMGVGVAGSAGLEEEEDSEESQEILEEDISSETEVRRKQQRPVSASVR